LRKINFTLILIIFLFVLVSCKQSVYNVKSNKKDGEDNYSIISIQPEYDLFDICLDSENNTYYADKNQIYKIDEYGKQLLCIGNSLKFCSSITVNDEKLYAWDSTDKLLKGYTLDGKIINEYYIELEKVRKMDVIGNIAVFLCLDRNNIDNSFIFLYNMKSSSSHISEFNKVTSFTRYKDNKIILSVFNTEGQSQFYEYDLMSKKSTILYEEPTLLYDIYYCNEDDVVYYCGNKSIKKISFDRGISEQVFTSEDNVMFKKLYISNDSCFALNGLDSNIYKINIITNSNVENGVLRFITDSSSIEETAKVKKAVELFKQSNTNSNVSFKSINQMQYYQLLKTKLMSNDNDFDIFLTHELEIDNLVTNRAVHNLGTYKEIVAKFENMFDGILDKCTYQGILVGVPQKVSFEAWGVNDSLQKELKIKCPENQWTWDDFYNMAKLVRKDINGDGAADIYIYNSMDYILDWVRQYNSAYFDTLNRIVNYNTDEFKNLLAMTKKLKSEDLISIGTSNFKEMDDILFYNNSFCFTRGDMHLIYPPTLVSKKIYPTNINLFCINPNSKNKSDAVKFLATYISKEVQTVEPIHAIYKDISQYQTIDELGMEWDMPNSSNYSIYQSIMKNAVKQQGHKDFNEFMVNKINEFLDGSISAEKAAEDIQARAEMVIGE